MKSLFSLSVKCMLIKPPVLVCKNCLCADEAIYSGVQSRNFAPRQVENLLKS